MRNANRSSHIWKTQMRIYLGCVSYLPLKRSRVVSYIKFACALKAGFHMIADDRGSQIVDDRKESCFHIIANDRRADWSHTFRSAEMLNVHVRCARGKIAANNMADIEEEILLQAKLFLLLVLKRRHRQLQSRRKHRFWVRKIFMKNQKVSSSTASDNDHTQFLCCRI